MSAQQDHSNIQETIDEFYAIISGRKGEERDWDTFRSLFLSGNSILNPVKFNAEKEPVSKPLNVDSYIHGLKSFLLANDFYEYGLNYEISVFGHIAQVYSEYEAKRSKEDLDIIKRGINLVLLTYDGAMWRIHSMLWQDR
ncbi:hypothetical protein ['Paenibacillus yunnanensis' Narsing Rao et al. 2020]|uniref:hypothetical protein n=1 Tax=Paenibacillus tengchongensis TaxID=2608684 RepID=UPI0016522FBE|nr:hypothetical protein [Paenibacillus tengchongensis]